MILGNFATGSNPHMECEPMPRAARKACTRSSRRRRSIGDLYHQFEKAHAAYNTIPVGQQMRWEPALDKAIAIAEQIADAPAETIDEMLLKIRIAGWDLGVQCKRLEDLDFWKPRHGGAEQVVLVTLREDLRRLNAPAKLIALANKLASVR
jgi:hypothetical protein